MPVRQWRYDQSAIVGTVALATHHLDSLLAGISRYGPLALLPLADDRKVAMVWSLDDSAHPAIAELTDEAFLRALNRALGPEARLLPRWGRGQVFRQGSAMQWITLSRV